MNVNLQAWDNFLGRALIIFLVIEGLKTFPWIARASRPHTARSTDTLRTRAPSG